MKAYECERCHARVFFENLICLSCQGELGYVPAEDVFRTQTEQANWHTCAHREDLGCNWLIADSAANEAADAAAKPLCDCCRFTTIVPALDEPQNLRRWQALEQAKRYLFYSLNSLQLSAPDRQQEPDKGLAFQFLSDAPEKKILTGHDAGIITINIAEADDVQREQRRVALHEPYRTLLGHLRHEIGHFFWDQLIEDSQYLDEYRDLFGDERADYAQALQQHYQQLDTQVWPEHFISFYASAHPWEDWAETWAHYLHIHDALDTAANWGITLHNVPAAIAPQPIAPAADIAAFKQQINLQWLPLCQYLNAASRSLGEGDAYPYVLSAAVIDKLAFIHKVIVARPALTQGHIHIGSPAPTAPHATS